MYITKDKDGNPFKWSKKGKNRECWIKDKTCITRNCFVPNDCGSVDQKTQQKNIMGICQTYYDAKCPRGYHKDDNCPTEIKNVKIIGQDMKKESIIWSG